MSDARPGNQAEQPPLLVVLFGATGDLARRKLFPALFELRRRGLLGTDFAVIGSGRHSPGSDDDFRKTVADAVRSAAGEKAVDAEVRDFVERVSFVPASAEDGDSLAAAVTERGAALGTGCRTLVYLSVPPESMSDMLRMVQRTGISEDACLLVEKPFGEDVPSARALNAVLLDIVPEERVFRIDHFLCKEAVRNLLTLRTANGWPAALWNAKHVAWVQIDVPEKIDSEGRAAFMEATGTFRDMVPTHLCQIAGQVAMEPPAADTPEAARAARLRLFRDMRVLDPKETVFGQYDGYREEDGVADDSTTETFAALRVWIDNPRWDGVPFLLRTGKALGSSDAAVTIGFRPVVDGTEADGDSGSGPGDAGDPDGSGGELVAGLDDPRDVRIGLDVARPGPGGGTVRVDLRAGERDAEADAAQGPCAEPMDAYGHVFLNAFRGDHTPFTSAEEVERLWEIATPVLENPPPSLPYPKGSFGPDAAVELPGARGWRIPEERTD